MHAGVVRRSLGWRGWIAVAAVALAGAAVAAPIQHGDHGTDPDCTVCQLRHQPAADLSGHPVIGPAADAELLDQLPLNRRIPADRFSRLPARDPPA